MVAGELAPQGPQGLVRARYGDRVGSRHCGRTPLGVVRTGFHKVVEPRPKLIAYVVVYAELALGLGLVTGFLTPVALVAGLLLNLLYLTLMIHDWAEQGQNAMMALISLVALFAMAWQTWSLDAAFGLFL
ncbi:DoxX family membrane protein [Streptomyces sp. SCSIO-PteL053]|nr:DoxX family membrane protein [Streptomyces sp. SCSIO-PteL053]